MSFRYQRSYEASRLPRRADYRHADGFLLNVEMPDAAPLIIPRFLASARRRRSKRRQKCAGYNAIAGLIVT